MPVTIENFEIPPPRSPMTPSPRNERLSARRAGTPEVWVFAWVVAVHSNTGASMEHRRALGELRMSAPVTEILEIKKLVDAVKRVAEREIYDPELVQLANSALSACRVGYLP